ncbi:MAG: YdcF family protein, partial [Reyranellales bacterium]
LAFAETIVLSFPPVADVLMGILEDEARAAAAAPSCCYDAIVVLGGGILPALPPARPEPDLTDEADRMWEAARLYHGGIAPRIIVSGGGVMAVAGHPETAEAAAMRRFLQALGVPDTAIISEDASLNTIDNTRNVHDLIKDGRVALVTSAYHMPRALRLAENAKLKADAFPTDFRVFPSTRPSWDRWIPSVDSLRLSSLALREILALVFDRRAGSLMP